MADQDDIQDSVAARRFAVSFPSHDGAVAQDEEWCEVALDGHVRRFRLHDYAALYRVPGLYEHLIYEELRCRSPQTVCRLLGDELRAAGIKPSELAVLDVGAGNGMVGEELGRLGVGRLVGVDVLEEAAQAARRDRPGLYDGYFTVDLAELPDDVRRELEGWRFNCLVSVAALGFGDIPAHAFAGAFDLVSDGGWIAFSIKDEFLERADDPTGFPRLIQDMFDDGQLELLAQRRYRHRLSTTGEPLHYVAIVARKRRPMPSGRAAQERAGR